MDELKARKITQKTFADIIDVPVSALNEIIKGKKNLTPELCVRIEEAL
ncbi:MAG: helix-turn-helix transcriptional regulator [Patescibacteria group bacterium]|nr:helix-turn-helix transcriptional regulator [Patescibacteria group bacterium]